MKVSIITPSYNQGDFIGRTMQSVLEQVSPEFAIEYIIVDAVSKDTTDQVVKEWLPTLTAAGVQCRYISEPDHGQADAINKGWRLATGEIITYLNSDDYYQPQSLAAVVKCFQTQPALQWAYGGWNLVNRGGAVYTTIQPQSYSKAKLLYSNNVGQPSCFFRRELLAECGLLREQLHLAMDYDLWLRFAERYSAGIIQGVIGNMRYYSDAKSAALTRQQLAEMYKISSHYTRPFSWRRLTQLFSYGAGLTVLILHIDIARRIEYFSRQQATR